MSAIEPSSARHVPRVSIVMPAFNAERYIAEALRSVEAQTMRDLEVVIVDDGSTDGTIDEVNRFSDRLDITLLRQSNAGPSAARNNGIRHARADYCAFLDADDIMLPELLETHCALLDADPEVGMVISDITTFDEAGVRHQARWNFAGRPREPVLDELAVENFVTTSAVVARRKCVMEVGMFPEDRRQAEDYQLWLRLAARWKLVVVDRPLVRYRYAPSSLSADKLLTSRAAIEVVEAFWNEHPEQRLARPRAVRRSMARHRANYASVALDLGQRRVALSSLLHALREDPGAKYTWKWLVKALILPARRAPPRTVTRATGSP